jgi:hypothetical protein
MMSKAFPDTMETGAQIQLDLPPIMNTKKPGAGGSGL